MTKTLSIVLFFLISVPLAAQHPGLKDPSQATKTAPDEYRVQFKTTKGDFTVKVKREWAPNGADRFYNLVDIGYFKNIAFFRVIEGFMSQFGLHGDPEMTAIWNNSSIPDDPPKAGVSNVAGTLVFANRGPNTRSSQLYINTVDNNANPNLDRMGFTPIGKVEGDGLEIVRSLYNGYGEGMPRGRGPSQATLTKQGNSYLEKYFPRLDYITSIKLIED